MSDDIRTLAQAVVDASDAWNAAGTEAAMRAAARQCDLAEAALDHGTSRLSPYQRARAILAALNAADAQGYARAMGDAADRAMAVASSYGPKPASGYAEGAQDALHSLADDLDGTAKLARERLPAAKRD